MPYHRNTCVQCGKVYYPKTDNRRNKFCSDACSQKDYRIRKKVQRQADQQTMPMDAFLIQEELFGKHPDLKDHLLGFYSIHGKHAYVDVLYILSLFMPTQKEIA